VGSGRNLSKDGKKTLSLVRYRKNPQELRVPRCGASRKQSILACRYGTMEAKTPYKKERKMQNRSACRGGIGKIHLPKPLGSGGTTRPWKEKIDAQKKGATHMLRPGHFLKWSVVETKRKGEGERGEKGIGKKNIMVGGKGLILRWRGAWRCGAHAMRGKRGKA